MRHLFPSSLQALSLVDVLFHPFFCPPEDNKTLCKAIFRLNRGGGDLAARLNFKFCITALTVKCQRNVPGRLRKLKLEQTSSFPKRWGNNSDRTKARLWLSALEGLNCWPEGPSFPFHLMTRPSGSCPSVCASVKCLRPERNGFGVVPRELLLPLLWMVPLKCIFT